MRRQHLNPEKFNPDDLSFYVWDHLNISVRLKRLGLNFQRKNSQQSFPDRLYRRDVPLARGYGDGKSPRPTSFCRITVTEPSGGTSGLTNTLRHFNLHVYFHFGWLRRTSSVYKVKHKLVLAPEGDFHWECHISEHSNLEAFEKDMVTLIKRLTEHKFDNLEELFIFMGHWINARYADDRTFEATTMTRKQLNKLETKQLVPPVKVERQHKYRMGRVNAPRFNVVVRR